jgi:hypothetical protein
MAESKPDTQSQQQQGGEGQRAPQSPSDAAAPRIERAEKPAAQKPFSDWASI